MKVSLSWLKTHIDLGDAPIDELCDLLTFAGIEVEGIEQTGLETDKVVVAQIQSFTQHPNADKLSVCQVDDGSGQARQIVCGAKNFKEGDKVPLALAGAKLPGGIEIKEGKLRDVLSQGMMCSAKELGLGEDTGGLWILDPALPIGKPIKELLDSDVVFDLEITPNRPDLLSHVGLARELAALTKKAYHPATKALNVPLQATSEEIVKIAAPEACAFYSALRFKNVQVAPSPDWLQKRLQSIGLRPINNIVDITNFVLMEVGQPLHAFDAAKVNGGIQVRFANSEETLKALDGQDYTLESTDLVIADTEKALAIAGVMGGEESGVIEGTTDVILEAAYFTPSQVRRTARKLVLHSDSSYRFERGVDPQNVIHAAQLAAQLIQELAGAELVSDILTAGEAPKLTQDVVFDEVKAFRLLGLPHFDRNEAHELLSSLGLTKLSQNDSSSTWSIPSYRLDLTRSVDLVEEIARIISLERIPSNFSAAFAPSQAPDRAYDFVVNLRHHLVNKGFFEAQTLRLISHSQLADILGQPVDPQKAVAPKNPLSEDHTTLRPSVIPGLVATAALNIRQGLKGLRFFEAGRVFITNPNGSSREEERLGVLLSGPKLDEAWNSGKEIAIHTIHDLKGILATLPGLANQEWTLTPKPLKGWLLSAEIKRGSKSLGWIAQLHPARARQIDARHPIFVAELSLNPLSQASAELTKFTALPKFPSVTRDVALEIPADLDHAKIEAFFKGVKEPLLVGAELFDVFSDPSGAKLAIDKKSVAWRITYRSADRTLSTKEVDEAHQNLLKNLLATLPASIR